MTVSAGMRLGPYEVLGPLGAGGMGEVYRAWDTRLQREVAVKVLPAELASDTARLKRLESEARLASALNHPNIVTIHEVGQSDSTSFIVMELVDGKTLRELLYSGPLPLRKLLSIAAQVADGLGSTRGDHSGAAGADCGTQFQGPLPFALDGRAVPRQGAAGPLCGDGGPRARPRDPARARLGPLERGQSPARDPAAPGKMG